VVNLCEFTRRDRLPIFTKLSKPIKSPSLHFLPENQKARSAIAIPYLFIDADKIIYHFTDWRKVALACNGATVATGEVRSRNILAPPTQQNLTSPVPLVNWCEFTRCDRLPLPHH